MGVLVVAVVLCALTASGVGAAAAWNHFCGSERMKKYLLRITNRKENEVVKIEEGATYGTTDKTKTDERSIESKDASDTIVESPNRDTSSALYEDQELTFARTPLGRCASAESLESVASDSSIFEGQSSSTGQLEITINYLEDSGCLLLTIVQARDLKMTNQHKPLDTFVKIFIEPDEESKAHTKIAHRCLSPIYNEKFLFNIPKSELDYRALRLVVLSCDRFSRIGMLGVCRLRLSDLNLVPNPFTAWLDLAEMSDDETTMDLGDVLVSLSYLPTAARLMVIIVKARNLKWTDQKETADPFVKVYLLQDGKKISKKRTSVKRSESCPIYNEAMIFSAPASLLEALTIRITVAENILSSKAPSVGHVLIGPSSGGAALVHWQQMMSSPRKPIAMWHPLQKY
ncbi:synaptotagmin-12-like [Anneissia japonica]|uniref:synaptotagmin-12-like n=1 Tax=Anneissia japonica TaxID=1529436 RepID=UPI001425954D|nr:synaptotagmin-12-like [Anneissia japonica]